MTADDFEFLRLGECVEVPTINDVRWFEELMQSFEHIQFSKQELDTVLSSLAAIMLLGNLKFDMSTLTDKNPCDVADVDLF
jgi:myosin heavy subunit